MSKDGRLDIRHYSPLVALAEPLRKHWATAMAMYPTSYSSKATPEHIAHTEAHTELLRAIAKLIIAELQVQRLESRVELWESIYNCEWDNGSLLARDPGLMI